MKLATTLILSLTFTLICDISLSQINIVDTQGASVGQSDGLIILEAAGTAGPFTISIARSGIALPEHDMNSVNGLVRIEGLSGGDYEIIVIDRLGCETILTINIPQEACRIDIVTLNIKNGSSCNHCNGSAATNPCVKDARIEIEVQSNVSDLVYEWFDEMQNTYPQSSTVLMNIAGDERYFLKVSSETGGCSDFQIFEVGACSLTDVNCQPVSSLNNVPEISSSRVLGVSSPTAEDGFIYVQVVGRNSDYHSFWTVEGDDTPIGSGDALDGIGVGSYCYNLVPNCFGATVQQCFIVPCVSRYRFTPLTTDNGCNTASTLSITSEDVDFSDITIDWMDGQTGTTIDVAEFQEYCATIRTIGTDCEQEYCVYPDIIGFDVVNVINSCPDIPDGSISIRISNPNEEALQVFFNGADVTTKVNNNGTRLTIYDLPISSHRIEVVVGDCVIVKEVIVEEAEFEYETVETFEENNDIFCKNDVFCKGRKLDEEFNDIEQALTLIDFNAIESSNASGFRQGYDDVVAILTTSVLDIFFLGAVSDVISKITDAIGDAIGGIFGGSGYNCVVPLLCKSSGEIIETDYGVGTLRAHDYITLINTTPTSILPQEIKNHFFSQVPGFDLQSFMFTNVTAPCRNVKFCKQTMAYLNASPGYTSISGALDASEPCTFGCGDLIPESLCEFNEELVIRLREEAGVVIPGNICLRSRTESIADLLNRSWEFPTNSGLSKYLLDIRDKVDFGVYIGTCLKVTYCRDDLSIQNAPLVTDLVNTECGKSIPITISNRGEAKKCLSEVKRYYCDEVVSSNNCKLYACSARIGLVPCGSSEILCCEIVYNWDVDCSGSDFKESTTKSIVPISETRNLAVSDSEQRFRGILELRKDRLALPSFVVSAFYGETFVVSNEGGVGQDKFTFSEYFQDSKYSEQSEIGYNVAKVDSVSIVAVRNGMRPSIVLFKSEISCNVINSNLLNSSIYMDVAFDGGLQTQDSILAGIDQSGLARLELSSKGKLINYQLYDIEVLTSFSASSSDDRSMISYSTSSGISYHLNDGGMNMQSFDISRQGSIEIKDQVVDNTGNLYMAVVGNGSLSFSNQQVSITSGKAYLIKVDSQGALIHQYSSSIVNSDDINIDFCESSNSILFSSRSSSVTDEIRIERFDASLSNLASYNIPFSEGFTLKDILDQGNNKIYFGGELKGRGVHDIGSVRFINFNQDDSERAYMSYLPYE